MIPHQIDLSARASKMLFIGLLSFVLCDQAEAQKAEGVTLSKTNLYVDAGGHFAGQVSINYEGRIHSGEKVTWYVRGGVGAAGVIMTFGGPGVLGGLTMLTGKGKNHFEISGGVIVGKDFEQDDGFALPLIDFGYRYQKPEGGFIFKAKVGLLGIGIGLGYAF